MFTSRSAPRLSWSAPILIDELGERTVPVDMVRVDSVAGRTVVTSRLITRLRVEVMVPKSVTRSQTWLPKSPASVDGIDRESISATSLSKICIVFRRQPDAPSIQGLFHGRVR